jgi:hypothetical protein
MRVKVAQIGKNDVVYAIAAEEVPGAEKAQAIRIRPVPGRPAGRILDGVSDLVRLDPVIDALDVDAGIIGPINPIPFDHVVGDAGGTRVSFARQHYPIVVKIVKVIMEDFIVLPVQVHPIAFAKEGYVIRNLKPRHPNIVSGYRKPLRYHSAGGLESDGALGRAGAGYVDALRIVSFRYHNRITRQRRIGSLLDGLPGGAGGSIIGIIPVLRVNV